MSFRLLWSSALLGVCTTCLWTAEVTPPPVDPASWLVEVLAHLRAQDPAVQHAQAGVAVAEAHTHSLGRWDDPVLGIDVRRRDAPGDDGTSYEVSVLQPLPVGGRQGRRAAGRAAVTAQRAAADAAEVALLAQIRTDVIQLEANAANEHLAATEVVTLQRLLATTDQHLAITAITEADRLRVRVEYAEAEQAAASASRRHHAARATAERHLGAEVVALFAHAGTGPSGSNLGFAPPPDRSDLAAALIAHPLLRAAQAEQEVAHAAVRAAQAARRPALAVGVVAARDGDSDEIGLLVDVSLPIFQGGRAEAVTAVWELRQRTAHVELTQRELLDAAEIAWDAWHEAELTWQGLQTSILPDAARAAELDEAAYARGETSVATLLATQRTVIRLRQQAARAHADALRARTELDLHLGRTLGRTLEINP